MHLVVIAILCAISTITISSAYSQQEQANTPTLRDDSDFPYPVAQGHSGRSDLTAMAEIEACEKVSSLPANTSLDVQGHLHTGVGNITSVSEVSLAMEGNGRFRMDIRDSEGRERGMRMIGRSGRIIGGPASIHPPSIGEFGDPLMFPLALKSIVFGRNVALVDDGVVALGTERLHKITVTHFATPDKSRPATSMQPDQALVLYFDPTTHLLKKSAVVNHSLTDVALKYLQVTSYEAYKPVDAIMVPNRYVQTVAGQRVLVLDLTNIRLSQPHGEAYFK
jgi:hypothetical protein